MYLRKKIIRHILVSGRGLLAAFLIMLLACMPLTVFAENVPHGALYDSKSVSAVFQQIKNKNLLYSDFKLVDREVDESDASCGIIAEYYLVNDSDLQNDETAEILVYYDDSPISQELGIPPQALDLEVICTDGGKNGEWLNFAVIYGEVLKVVTGDTAAADWIRECAEQYYAAYITDPSTALMDDMYEGDGFSILCFNVDEGFSFIITVSPE